MTNWLRLKGNSFAPCLMESDTIFFLLEACRLSLLPAAWFLRLPRNCECLCDMVMTNRTGSAKRFLEGHFGLVQQRSKPPNMFQPSVPAAAGSHLVESRHEDKADQGGSSETGNLPPALTVPDACPTAGLPSQESVDSLWFKSGLSGISAIRT